MINYADYKDFSQIERDLKVLKLKREIAVEEMKNIKDVAGENLSPSEWVHPLVYNIAKKFGFLYLLKKIF